MSNLSAFLAFEYKLFELFEDLVCSHCFNICCVISVKEIGLSFKASLKYI